MNVINVCCPPSMIDLGYDGENLWRSKVFDCGAWFRKAPGGVVSLWLWPTGGSKRPVSVTVEGDLVTWTPQDADITVGTGKLQLVYQVDERTGMSAVSYYRVSESIPGGEDSETPSWALDVTQKMADAVSHYPKIENGYWYVWDVDNSEWVDTGVKASSDDVDPEAIADAVADYLEENPITVTETDPTVPAWAKNPTKPSYTASEVGALPSDTVIPAAVTEQTVAGWGFTKNTGTYSKPSTGIPKTDLAADVQTSLSKADTALQQHQSLSGYATETWVGQQGYQTETQVQTAISNIPDELPTVTTTDNGKFLRVVSGAWAAATVPSAESNSFGGGS